MLSIDDEEFEYDSLGNPTTYRNNELKWNYLRNLEKFGDIATYKYNASGIRTSKIVDSEETKFYLNGNKVVAQDDETNRIIFYYGIDELTGFSLNGVEYVYKKNIQNDIIGIYDTNGNQLVKYVYDAWGNHKTFVLYQGNFVDISLENDYTDDNYQGKVQLATLNPFRYRSYYFDEETGLYYLNSRYYDPDLGRFINADKIDLLNETKEVINGLNLYSYCLNNPIMNLDDTGEIPNWLSWLFKALAVVVVAVACVALAVVTAGAGLGVVGAALTAGFVGAGGSLTRQLISDIGTSIITGSWYMSSFNDYLGAAIGGFAGGITLALTGNVTLAFGVSSGVSSLSTSLLNGESILNAALKGLISFGIGMITGKLLGGTKIQGITKGIGNYFSVFKSGLTKMAKYAFNMSTKVVLKGFIAMILFKSGSYVFNGLLNGLDFSKLITQIY